jgi:hypothetical protein
MSLTFLPYIDCDNANEGLETIIRKTISQASDGTVVFNVRDLAASSSSGGAVNPAGPYVETLADGVATVINVDPALSVATLTVMYPSGGTYQFVPAFDWDWNSTTGDITITVYGATYVNAVITVLTY